MSVTARIQRLLREVAAAKAAGDGHQLVRVRDELWDVQQKLFGPATEGDLEATACLIDVARPSIELQLASHNWAAALGSCHMMAIALANVEAAAHRDDRHVPDFFALLRNKLGEVALWVPRTSSTSCDQAVFVDYAADARVSSDTVLLKIDRFG